MTTPSYTWSRWLVGLVLAACSGGEEPVEDTGAGEVEQRFPVPEDVGTLDWQAIFTEAVDLMVAVNTQAPFNAHRSTMDTRVRGCPDFWTGEFTVGLETVGDARGVSWYDDCLLDSGLYYDGWLWWQTDVVEFGDPKTDKGRVSDAFRQMEGNAVVGDDKGVRFEFKGTATDTLSQTVAPYYERFTYSTTVRGTVTGRDAFEGTATPRGYRTDLFMYVTGGDADAFEARGNVYMFEPQLRDRFDSIQVDFSLRGENAAAPGDCIEEPLGWIGVRDANAYWYDVVFQPRSTDDIVGERFPNKELSACDGCGRLYVQGIEQPVDVCVDFSFLFDGRFPVPDADEFVLPIRSL